MGVEFTFFFALVLIFCFVAKFSLDEINSIWVTICLKKHLFSVYLETLNLFGTWVGGLDVHTLFLWVSSSLPEESKERRPGLVSAVNSWKTSIYDIFSLILLKLFYQCYHKNYPNLRFLFLLQLWVFPSNSWRTLVIMRHYCRTFVCGYSAHIFSALPCHFWLQMWNCKDLQFP